jgi:hypothetical protein
MAEDKMEPRKSEKAEEALFFIETSFNIKRKRGEGLGRKEDAVRRLVLRRYPELGRAPTLFEISETLGISEEEVKGLLESLDRKDVLYLDGEGEVNGAYPFRNHGPHVVSLGKEGRKAYAMCAVDALGVPFMFREKGKVTSTCKYCGREIEVVIERGKVGKHSPQNIIIWIGKKCSEHAATSVCTTISFFCSPAHAEKWMIEKGEEGWALNLREALYVGKSLFEEALK